MKLLIDTDVFCKLQVAGLLSDAAGLLEARLDECGRLAALPHMLRRGRLRKQLGAEVCDALVPVAVGLPVAPQPSDVWLDRLVPIEGIDIGEAQLFAAAADTGLLVMSGDKRALRALKNMGGFPVALHGRIVVLETRLGHHRQGLRDESVGSLAQQRGQLRYETPAGRGWRPGRGGRRGSRRNRARRIHRPLP